jgi:hypothetical protein
MNKKKSCGKERSYMDTFYKDTKTDSSSSRHVHPQPLPSSYTSFAFCSGAAILFVFSDAETWKTKQNYEAELSPSITTTTHTYYPNHQPTLPPHWNG